MQLISKMQLDISKSHFKFLFDHSKLNSKMEEEMDEKIAEKMADMEEEFDEKMADMEEEMDEKIAEKIAEIEEKFDEKMKDMKKLELDIMRIHKEINNMKRLCECENHDSYATHSNFACSNNSWCKCNKNPCHRNYKKNKGYISRYSMPRGI